MIYEDYQISDSNSTDGNSTAVFNGVGIPTNCHGKLTMSLFGTMSAGGSVLHLRRVYEINVTRVGTEVPTWSGNLPSPTEDDTETGFDDASFTPTFLLDGYWETGAGFQVTIAGTSDGGHIDWDMKTEFIGQSI